MIAPLAAVGAGRIVVGAIGAVLLMVAVVDLFVTVFNYDGFSFVANRLHGWLWRLVRGLSRPLPDRPRHAVLSLGSAAMLPATYVLWLGLEVIAFALIFEPGVHGGGFTLHHMQAGIGAAFYLSAGAISSLTFGDIVPVSGLFRALVDLETIIGLTTFTIALGYVVTTFDVLRTLDALHSTVRRHAEDPSRPSSILARHFRGGEPTELPSLLGSLTEKLQEYDQGLRRYPVVYYFHTRRLQRSIPRVFAALGELIALLRWGLPAEERLTADPLLAALEDEYRTTLDRLQRSFVGPPEVEHPKPLPVEAFWEAYDGGREDGWVARFRDLQRRARAATQIAPTEGRETAAAYDQYREWLQFTRQRDVVLSRVADALGYPHL